MSDKIERAAESGNTKSEGTSRKKLETPGVRSAKDVIVLWENRTQCTTSEQLGRSSPIVTLCSAPVLHPFYNTLPLRGGPMPFTIRPFLRFLVKPLPSECRWPTFCFWDTDHTPDAESWASVCGVGGD